MLPRGSVSKWLKSQVLLDVGEVKACFEALGPVELYNVSGVVGPDALQLSQEDFLKMYQSEKSFGIAATVDGKAVRKEEVQPGKWIARGVLPYVQLQHHRFSVSKEDGQIHPMVMGPDTVSWGMQVSFPQVMMDEKGEVHKTAEYPNAALFSRWQKWLRAHTVPTSFIFNGVQINSSVRIGKKCFDWIDAHPQLAAHGLQIVRY